MKLKIKVHANSSREEIKKISDSEYEVWLGERTVNNKANIELIKLLKKHFNRDIKIKSGFSSRNKIIEVN